MALTYSEMIPLGSSAPDFSLLGIDQKKYSLASFSDKKALVVLFICNHCPYVIAVQDRIAKLANDYSKQVQFVGINSNDFTRYSEDSPEKMKEQALRVGFHFPYLIDEHQTTAKAYGAVCTPDIFVFDSSKKLAYRGRIDDSWKDQSKVTKEDLKNALDALLAGKKPVTEQLPSLGCSIKWKNLN